MSIVKKLFVVRHGQTDYNLKKIVQGRGVDASLDETGQEQANGFYKTYKSIHFDAIYASSLKRSQESIQRFLKEGIPYKETPLLDEISWGDYEGKKQTPEKEREFKATTAKWYAGETNIKMPNGESADDLHNRVKTFLTQLVVTDYEKILICSHGRTIRLILCELMGIPVSKMRTFNPENLGLYQLNWTPNQLATIIKQNDLAHFK